MTTNKQKRLRQRLADTEFQIDLDRKRDLIILSVTVVSALTLIVGIIMGGF